MELDKMKHNMKKIWHFVIHVLKIVKMYQMGKIWHYESKCVGAGDQCRVWLPYSHRLTAVLSQTYCCILTNYCCILTDLLLSHRLTAVFSQTWRNVVLFIEWISDWVSVCTNALTTNAHTHTQTPQMHTWNMHTQHEAASETNGHQMTSEETTRKWALTCHLVPPSAECFLVWCPCGWCHCHANASLRQLFNNKTVCGSKSNVLWYDKLHNIT